jgi:elongation factor P
MTASPVSAPCTDRRAMEYVYQDGDGIILLDPDTDELVTLPHGQAGDALLYLREGDQVHLVLHAGQPLSLEPPVIAELAVTDTDPPMMAATASRAALLETGLKVLVPASIRVGDTILVDTRSRTYLARRGEGRGARGE